MQPTFRALQSRSVLTGALPLKDDQLNDDLEKTFMGPSKYLPPNGYLMSRLMRMLSFKLKIIHMSLLDPFRYFSTVFEKSRIRFHIIAIPYGFAMIVYLI